MAECPSLKGCPFFNEKMPIESAMGTLYRKRFCLGDYETCARFRVSQAKGKEAVPVDLYPNQAAKAEEILLKD